MEGTSLPAAMTVQTRKNLPFLALFLLFLTGMVYGVLMLRGGSLFELLHSYSVNYLATIRENTLFQNFFSLFSSAFFYLLGAYLLGFSAIGQPFILLLPFFRGLGLGAFMGYFYVTYGLRGIGCCLLVVLPAALVALLALIIGCRESLRLSILLFSGFRSGKSASLGRNTLKLYHLKFLILIVFALISAILGTVCILLFAGLFQFT